jgi:hypothetical protein
VASRPSGCQRGRQWHGGAARCPEKIGFVSQYLWRAQYSQWSTDIPPRSSVKLLATPANRTRVYCRYWWCYRRGIKMYEAIGFLLTIVLSPPHVFLQPINSRSLVKKDSGAFFCEEGPRSRLSGRTAALRFLVQPCDEDDDDYCFALFVVMEHRWNKTDRGKPKYSEEKPVPVPLCPPQIPHGPTGDRNLACQVKVWRLTAWAMARPLWRLLPFWSSHFSFCTF